MWPFCAICPPCSLMLSSPLSAQASPCFTAKVAMLLKDKLPEQGQKAGKWGSIVNVSNLYKLTQVKDDFI